MELKRQYAMKARRRLKNELEREAKFSSTNRLMIQNQWRKIMRLAKVESLRKEIEIMSQNHERDVDRKDAVIQMLDRDLEEAEVRRSTPFVPLLFVLPRGPVRCSGLTDVLVHLVDPQPRVHLFPFPCSHPPTHSFCRNNTKCRCGLICKTSTP
jgi:hypothetical protein